MYVYAERERERKKKSCNHLCTFTSCGKRSNILIEINPIKFYQRLWIKGVKNYLKKKKTFENKKLKRKNYNRWEKISFKMKSLFPCLKLIINFRRVCLSFYFSYFLSHGFDCSYILFVLCFSKRKEENGEWADEITKKIIWKLFLYLCFYEDVNDKNRLVVCEMSDICTLSDSHIY